jgi:hypothetical protein
MKKNHQLKDIYFRDNYLFISIDEISYKFPLEMISQPLLNASETERQIYQISPSGYGIHWLVLDEDLSIDGLINLSKTNNYQVTNILY